MSKYLQINNNDFSAFVNTLNVTTEANYKALTNAAGNTVIDYINRKKTVEVGFIPMNETQLSNLLASIPDIVANLTFLNPATNQLLTIECLCPSAEVEYYTIQPNKILFKPFTLTFTEL